jgi:hypothetical protein
MRWIKRLITETETAMREAFLRFGRESSEEKNGG